jgi:AraC-like DNA-binding protein
MYSDKYTFSFFELDSDKSMNGLAASFDTTYINNSIQIPSQTGSGIIRKTRMEEGLQIRAWDFIVHKPFVFDKRKDKVTPDRVFHVAYILNPEALSIRRKDSKDEIRVQGGMNTLFVSNDINIEVEVARELGLHAIDISFTTSWLLRTIADSDTLQQKFMEQLLTSKTPTVFFESTSATEYRTLVDVHCTALQQARGQLQIKAGIYSLLAGFFDKILNKSLSEVLESKFFYHDKMLEVEKILIRHLDKKLPPIDEIAHKAALSESTLKRHFKLMFGKSIYEYYLELKMDYAKRLLMERPLSVNEVASMLDYEKVSNFIDMFKRHHGITPGVLRHK